jgi:hypothetical protein
MTLDGVMGLEEESKVLGESAMGIWGREMASAS